MPFLIIKKLQISAGHVDKFFKDGLELTKSEIVNNVSPYESPRIFGLLNRSSCRQTHWCWFGGNSKTTAQPPSPKKLFMYNKNFASLKNTDIHLKIIAAHLPYLMKSPWLIKTLINLLLDYHMSKYQIFITPLQCQVSLS